MRRTRTTLAALTFVATLLLTTTAGAGQVGPEQTGWWFVAQQLPDPVPPAPAPATVPAGGLYVSYAGLAPARPVLVNAPSDGTIAYGAVRYAVPFGSRATLTLTVATGSSALAAQLQACRVAGAWVPADGGQWYAQPGIDRTLCAKGVVPSSGNSVTFPISAAFTTDGRVDVAIAPDPDATPFSVSFNKPGAKSLSTDGGHVGPQLNNTKSPSAGSASSPQRSPGSSDLRPTPSITGEFGGGRGATGANGGDVGPEINRFPSTGGLATSTTIVHPPSAGRKLVVLAMLVALVVGWWWSSNPSRVFLFAAAGDRRRSHEDRNVFGIGRFARERSTPSDGL